MPLSFCVTASGSYRNSGPDRFQIVPVTITSMANWYRRVFLLAIPALPRLSRHVVANAECPGNPRQSTVNGPDLCPRSSQAGCNQMSIGQADAL